MKTTSVQLPARDAKWLKSLAKKTGESQSDIMRRFIEAGLKQEALSLSLADRMKDLEGHFSGPRDLSQRKAFEG